MKRTRPSTLGWAFGVAFTFSFSAPFTGIARAQDLKDRFNIRLSLSGMYLGETQGAASDAQNQSPLHLQIGYGDLRAVVDARRLPGGFDLHLDARVRVTGGFSTDAAVQGENQVTAPGYLGGREYEVRQAWVRRRGEIFDFGIGRLVILEADALKLDGLRGWIRFARHWELSLHAGTYPDPYSRSLDSDYVPHGFTFAGGAAMAYTYDRMWGSFSGTGAYLGGLNDGGPFDPANPLGAPKTEGVRAFVTWTNFVRLQSWLDLFHDVVVDVAGSAGAQLTRADVIASARLGKHLTVRVGYDHMSAVAIEMYLTRLLNGRADYVANTIENNLTAQRTARNEGRLQADLTMGLVSVYAEGELRQRAIVDLRDDPQFEDAGKQVAPGIAYDVTLGVRDRGSLWLLRPGLWASYISDYRARNIVVGVQLGRNFLRDRLTIDAQFLYASTRDLEAGQTCPAATPVLPSALQSCFGTRNGAEYEPGITITAQPFSHWFAILDYRFVIDTTDAARALYSNVLFLRLEARY